MAAKAPQKPQTDTAATLAAKTPEEVYLLGQFDCLCVPAQADFDSGFMPMDGVTPKTGIAGSGAKDNEKTDGFASWFWVLHTTAPNIGESEEADDFFAYSTVVPSHISPPTSSSGDGPGPQLQQRRLCEDLYVQDLRRLWQNALHAMGNLGIEEAIVFSIWHGSLLAEPRCKRQPVQ